MDLAENRNDILVYDKSEHLIKLVKHYCGNNVEVIFCNCDKNLAEFNLNSIHTAYVSSNEKCDFPEIELLYNSVENLYVNTQSLELKRNLRKFERVAYFNLDNDKFKIMEIIFNKIIDFN